MNHKLTIEEKESLIEFLTSPAWPALLKEVDRLATQLEASVMKYDLERGDRGLVIERARADGARKLQILIQGLKSPARGPAVRRN